MNPALRTFCLLGGMSLPSTGLGCMQGQQSQTGGQGYLPDQTEGQGYLPDQAEVQGYLPGQAEGQGYLPGQAEGQGYIPGQTGGQGYLPGQTEGQGYILGQTGGQGYLPGQTGGQGYFNGNQDETLKFDRCFDPVAFTVVGVSEETRSAPQQIHFNRVITNLGAGWDEDRSAFLTPISGTYSFSWSLLSSTASSLRVSLRVNSREVVATWAHRSGYSPAWAWGVYVTLQRGDSVYLVLDEGEVHQAPAARDTGCSTFAGHRIA